MKKYFLKNLDCAVCAAKIETALKNLDYVQDISLNFSSLTMMIDTDNIDKVEAVMKSIEPNIYIERQENKKSEEEVFNQKWELFFLCFCIISYIIAVIFQKIDYLEGVTIWIVYITLYLFSGYKVIKKALTNIIKGSIFDENFLMTIATLGAFVLKEFPEAVGVMIFFKVGEYLQDLSIHKSRKSIKALLEVKPDYANLMNTNGDSTKVSPESVCVGSDIVIKPGEKIPLDGVIVTGESHIDTSALTGESVPKIFKENDKVLAGMINMTGLLVVKVLKLFTESSIAKILEMVENATHKKAKTELFFTTFARYYTPIIVGITVLTALLPPLLLHYDYSTWIYRALVILVISCPCALVVSIPLTYFGGIGGASTKGILIKGSTFLDVLVKVKKIVFDKTGTLTKGVFKLTKVVPKGDNSTADLIHLVAQLEVNSNHPIAQVFKEYINTEQKKEIIDFKEHGGLGISATVDNQAILIGNNRLMNQNMIEIEESSEFGTVIYVAINRVFAGYMVISDELKPDTVNALNNLRDMGIDELHMLTGDNTKISKHFAETLGLKSFHAELMPEDKVKILTELKEDSPLIFVGDGINDAPVLALADVGISMGNLGTDVAIETADIVLMNDSLKKIPELLKIAKKTRSIIIQNISFALGVKLMFVCLGFVGMATMWEAVFADVGVTILAVFNARRIVKG